MDAIEALDDGANAHFTWQKREMPGVVPYMQVAYYISSYVGIGVLALLVIVILLWQRRRWAALATAMGFAAAIGVILALQQLVPRARPQLAVEFQPDVQTASYPSASVFLFMLGVVLLCCVLWDKVPSLRMRGVLIGVLAFFVVWVCLSQFFLAQHFVSDVIGAFAGAILIGWFTCKAIQADRPAANAPT
jgi:membrane-associated phospholipid phosphatase